MSSVANQNISFSKRIVDKIKNGLILQVLRNQLYRIGIEITPFYLTEVGTQLDKVPQIKGSNEGFSFGFLYEEDLIHMKNDPRGYAIEKLLYNLTQGRKCYGVKKGEHIAAFVFIDLKECNFKPLRFQLKENEAYTFSAYTMEAYRGRNIAPYMGYHCYSELKSMGRTKIYSVSEYFNRSAIKYKLKLGTKKLKLYLYIGLFHKVHRRFLLRTFS